MKRNIKKAIALAIAVNMLFPYSAAFAETTQQAGTQALHQRIQKILHPEVEEPTVAQESAPTPEEETQTEDEAPDTEKEVSPEKEQSTQVDWSKASACSENILCNGISSSGSNFDNILILLSTLFVSDNENNNNIATNSTPSTTINTEDYTNTDTYAPQGEFSDIVPAGTGDTVFYNVPTGPDMSGIQLGLLGGIPLGPNASYTYRIQGPGSVSVEAFVNPLNPEIDSATQFAARVTSQNASVHVYPPAQYASETYTEGGDKTKTFIFKTIEYAKNSRPRYGSVTVTVNAKVYEGTTSLCSSDDASCDNGLQAGSEFDANGNVISTTGDGVNNTGTSTVGDVVNNTGTSTTGGDGINTGTTGIDGTNTGTGTSTGDYFNTGTSGTSNSGLLDNLFNNTGTSSSNNGSSPDWLNDGFSSYNNENSSDSTVPADFGSQFAENGTGTGDGSDQFAMGGDGINGTNGTGGINGVTGGTNGINGDGGNGQFAYADENGTANGGNGSGTDVSGSSGGSSTASDGALGGIFSKIDSAIGNDPAASNSLTSKFASLTGTSNSNPKTGTSAIMDATSRNGLPGSSGTTATSSDTQGMMDVATQMLLAYGRSPEDIKSGKLFDAGSAYTDPQDAWNLNRMSAAKAKAQVKSTNLIVK